MNHHWLRCDSARVRLASLGLGVLVGLAAAAIPLFRARTARAGGDPDPVANALSLVAGQFVGPAGLAVGPAGQLYVADSVQGTVYRIDPQGVIVSDIVGMVNPQGILLDQGGNLYVADSAAGAVYRVGVDGQAAIVTDNLAEPRCLSFDHEGRLLVLHRSSEGDAIARLGPDGTPTLVATGFVGARAMQAGPAHAIIVAAEGFGESGSGIYQIGPSGEVAQLLDTGSMTPTGLVVGPDGTLYFCAASTAGATEGTSDPQGEIYAVHDGGVELLATGFSLPRAMAADVDSLYVADEVRGEVWRIALAADTAVSTEAAMAPSTAPPSHGSLTPAPIALPEASGGRARVSIPAARTVSAKVPAAVTEAASGVSTNCPDMDHPGGSGQGAAQPQAAGALPGCEGCSKTSWCRQPANKRNDPHDPKTCNPVNLATGVEEVKGTDLVIGGLMPIVFGHVYRSEDTSWARLGIGASHSYDYRVWKASDGDLWLVLPSNSRAQFVRQADGTFLNTNLFWLAGARLYDQGLAGDARYCLRFKDGTRFYFRSDIGYLSSIIDPNWNRMEFIYSATCNRHLVEIRAPSGRSLSLSYLLPDNDTSPVSQVTDNAGRSVSYGYQYDSALERYRLVTITNAVGGVTSFTYANSNLVSVTLPNQVPWVENFYDANGRVVTQTLANAGTYSFDYTLDGNDNVAQTVMRNPLGHATIYRFDETGFLTNTVDALDNSVVYFRDPSDGVVRRVIDPLVRTSSFVYDANRNLTALTNALGQLTSFTYETNYNRLTSVTDPLAHTVSFGYDALGNLIGITNAVGTVTQIAYNQFGLPTAVTDPLDQSYTFGYNETLDLVAVTDPLGNTVRRSIDAVGRPYALTDPFGRTTRIAYTDQSGCGCAGAPDRVASVTDPLNGPTKFSYDAVGNLTNVTDALSHAVIYAYDNMNRLTSRTDQLGNLEVYRYDRGGNVTNYVDRRGISVVLSYDALDRRTGVVYGTESNVKLVYDKVGRVTNLVDSTGGTIQLSYDSLDRLVQEIGPNGTNSYAYNDVGLRTNLTTTGETPVTYLYDDANRLTNVVQGTTAAWLFYDDAGRRTKLILPNGINVLYSYHAGSRLTNITYLAAATNQIDYTYWVDGNRASQVSALAIYNLPSQITNSAYNAANQQLAFGSYSILYDAAGNVTNIVSGSTTNRLQWNARGQLTNLLGSVTASFAYDGLGRRIRRTATNTRNYQYDGLDAILEKDASGAIVSRYFRGLGIDEPWQFTVAGNGGTNYAYLADALGSIVALTLTNEAVTTQYAYEPFGKSTSTGTPNPNPYTFTAREDDGTGFYYYRARYYHPGLMRFISEDPMEFVEGPALYTYVLDDPINGDDPLGLYSVGKWWRDVKGGTEAAYDYLYTGEIDPAENTRRAAYGGAGTYLSCQLSCMGSVNKQILAAAVAYAGASPAFPLAKEALPAWMLKGIGPVASKSPWTSPARASAVWSRRYIGSRSFVYRSMHGLASHVENAPFRTGARGGMVAAAWAEFAITVYCAIECKDCP